MSMVSSSYARAAVRAVAASPAAAGFRPAAAVLAIAMAFSAHGQQLPTGGQAIHGTANISNSGGSGMTVTTTNGSGTSHSAINWNSFSIGTGKSVHFQQPDVASTSINRVVQANNPSVVDGGLTSNGKLVLVNPFGIAFGAGAVVDTAGFTASTLAMSDADALAGKLKFSASGTNGTLRVAGRIVATGGDIVLIAPQVQTDASAVIQSPDGATILAAGQSVEITGRGLEGIFLSVQAPTDQTVNLGRLDGNAVGIFAGTLTHSGSITADAVDVSGGKVVLKANGGNAVVNGGHIGAIAGSQSEAKIEVSGESVALTNGSLQTVDSGGGHVLLAAKNGIQLGGNILQADPGSTVHLLAETGDIVQDSLTSVIWASDSALYAGAKAGRVLLPGVNRVGLAAGESFGPGAQFQFRNDQQLNVGTVITPYGSFTGIHAHDGSNPGIVELKATSGDLVLRDFVPITGGTITLAATSDTGDVLLDQVSLQATDGALTVSAGRDVRIGTLDTSGGSTWLQGNQSVSLAAGRDVLLGTTASSPSYVEVSSPGQVNVGAGHDVVVGAGTQVRADSAAGAGVRMVAGNDAVFHGQSFVWTSQAPISVTATNNIAGQGYFSTGGGGTGSVTLTATNGSLAFGTVDASGMSARVLVVTESTGPSSPAPGGDITLTARGGVNGGDLYAYGSSAAAAGGTVRVTSQGGDIGIGSVHAHGGDSWDTPDAGGSGGKVFLSATGGGIVASFVDVGGGTGESGGNGGGISVQAAGNVNIQSLYAAGGDGRNGAGGTGGTVDVLAGGDIVLAPTEFYYPVSVDGGWGAWGGSSGAGGDAGTITLRSTGGSITARSAPYAGTEAQTSETSSAIGVTAAGGYGVGTGGHAGTVVIEAASNLDLGSVDAYGGSGYGSDLPVTHGGNGGQVTLRFGGSQGVDAVYANGGWGTDGSSGGNGGAGGSILFERTAGSLALTGSSLLDASGGFGGSATTADGTGGNGGPGGHLTLASVGGGVTLDAPQLQAGGGFGGMHGDGFGQGAPGALGTLSVLGSQVDVTGFTDLNAIWTNGTTVNLGGSSFLGGMGLFRNEGVVNVSDAATLFPGAGFENLAGGRLVVPSGSVTVNLTQNTGRVEVAAGGSLDAPYFLRNDGLLLVDGTLGVGHSCDGCLLQTASVSGPTFINAAGATLAGNGTFAVGDGLGTVDNLGTIAPGGFGGIGTLTLSGGLVMGAGSTLAIDLAGAGSHDVLKVSGPTVSGGNIAVTYASGASFNGGESFPVLEAGSVDSTTLPTVSVPELTAASSDAGLLITAASGYPAPPAPPPPPPPPSPPAPAPAPAPPAPAPAPAPAPTPAPAPAPAAAAEQQMVSQTVTFATLFIQEATFQQQEERRRNEIGKDGIVVTDTVCKP